MLFFARLNTFVHKHPGPSFVMALAFVLLLGAGLYGLNAPFVFGHLGYHGGEYSTRARHTLHNGVFLPVNMPGHSYPGDASLYLHHPILTHHLVSLGFALLGEHEYAVRLAALLAALAMSAAFCGLLLQQAGPWPAAFGVLVFNLIPINLWYNTHIDPGFPGMACVLIFFYFYFQFWETQRPKSALYALLALALACGFDWAPYLIALPAGFHTLYGAYRKRGRSIAFVPLFALALLLPLAIHFLIVAKTGHIAEMKAQYSARTVPMELAVYLKRIFVYAQAYFGLPLIALTTAWLPIAALRLLRGKGKLMDLAGFGFLFAFVFYVLWFRDGVMTHGYRMMYGSVSAAWASIDLGLSAVALLSPLLSKRNAVFLFALLGLGMVALLLPLSWSGLLESRAHQGIPDWKIFSPFIERSAFARELQSASKAEDMLYIHRLFPIDRMELAFYMNRDQKRGFVLTSAFSLKPGERAKALIVFPRHGLHPKEEAALAELRKQYAYYQVDAFAWIDMREDKVLSSVLTLKKKGQAERSLWDKYWNGPYPWPELVGKP